ncbi:hypothetical protein VP01_3405g2 [Puccinia sorghi]|uniref:Retrovirus-related Pol polyprotein from transposon TNT 1-94-like beta-barrel domain-containing protein n=1 Tax=Puccinia sorghi TaxID=27349 RepID=A0A0L6UWI4_9BASI|nr:hypothetical protein VP01_3405g2 [Puccinia sorghi]
MFILDSGSSSHMVSDRYLCGKGTLKIEGKGTIKLRFQDRVINFHNVLLVPKITVNILSLRHLLLEQCKIKFSVNHFTILKDNEPFLDGHYQNNLPKS